MRRPKMKGFLKKATLGNRPGTLMRNPWRILNATNQFSMTNRFSDLRPSPLFLSSPMVEICRGRTEPVTTEV